MGKAPSEPMTTTFMSWFRSRLSVGGFKYILSAGSAIERIFWTVVVTGGTLFVGYIIMETIKDFVVNPFHTELRDDYHIQVRRNETQTASGDK